MVRRALSGLVASLSMVGVLGASAVVALAVVAAPAVATLHTTRARLTNTRARRRRAGY
jgi:hypothetical protein